METKDNHHRFIKEMLLKQHEMINKELTEYLLTLGNNNDQQTKYNYADTCRKLLLYERTITSLNTQLELLKKENLLLQTYNKEIVSIKEDTHQLKTLISTIKGEVHDIHI